MTRKAWYFLGVTFTITWLIEGLALRTTLNEVGSGLSVTVLVFVAGRYVSTYAVLVVQKTFTMTQ